MMSNKIKRCEKVLPELLQNLERCQLCNHRCGVNRLKGEKGVCGAPAEPIIYTYYAHQGEEPPISGTKGSGTIFFSCCCMKCVYCQNWRFSQSDKGGRSMDKEALADAMLELEKLSCHNINLVSPTHFMPVIVDAFKMALEKGLTLPLVYNTGGYDSPELIRALDGIVDIYLPDMRYFSSEKAKKYSSVNAYAENNRLIVKEMFRQAGNLVTDEHDIGIKGLIIRLLILPGAISGTEDTLEFIRKNIGTDVYLSVMSQYYPAHKAKKYVELSRGIKKEEYQQVVEKVNELGFANGWIQPFGESFDPDFAGENF